TLATSIEHIRAGKLRALAVTSAARPDVLPDTPTVGDFVPGYEASSWQGVGGPRTPPRASILSAHIAHALVQREITRRGRNVAHGHRRCRRGDDPAQRNTGH